MNADGNPSALKIQMYFGLAAIDKQKSPAWHSHDHAEQKQSSAFSLMGL